MQDDLRSANEKLLDAGCEGTPYFIGFSYDSALIGTTDEGAAVYDYDLMIDWIVRTQGWSYDDSVEWIEYNTIRAIPYMGDLHPVILHRF